MTLPGNETSAVGAWQDFEAYAKSLGFDDLAAVPAGNVPPEVATFVRQWMGSGQQGSMTWMERSLDKRLNPELVMPGVRFVVILTASYDSQPKFMGPFRIGRYAASRDYHRVLEKHNRKLVKKARILWPGSLWKDYVDHGPILERYWGAKAGLGWIGKNTMLIQRGKGSYFFLSVLLTDAPLQTPPLREVPFSCGTCTACLDACPTQALTPGVLDSRRCLSYLTLEQPHPLSPQEGSFGWLAGCDICQEVCPWNRKPSNAIHHALIPHERFAKPQKGPHPPQEGWYAYWTDHTPLKRIPQERLATNWQTLDTMTPVQASHPSHRSEPIEGVDPDDHPPNHTL